MVRNLGVVRGLTVRSRSIVGTIFGSLQTLFGGNMSVYRQLCELMAGLTEVLCYGTAVQVEPARADP